MNILVVDDDSVVRMSLRTLLTSEGYRVTTADDGESALIKLSEEKFDLLVCDVYMPYLDGARLRSIIREMPLCARLPILFISGHDDVHTTNVIHDPKLEGFFKKGKPVSDLLAWVKYLLTPVNKRSHLSPNVVSKPIVDPHFYNRGRDRGGLRTPIL